MRRADTRGEVGEISSGSPLRSWDGRQPITSTVNGPVTTQAVECGRTRDNVRAAIESVGSLVLWSLAIEPGRPVAIGVIAGTPFIGLPGNPVASFVTFAHVVRPTILALLGTSPEPRVGLPVRAAFAYKKKTGRAEYVRAGLQEASDGSMEAVKFPREGAGLLWPLADTDGIIELGEDVERVSPGETVRFLAYPIII